MSNPDALTLLDEGLRLVRGGHYEAALEKLNEAISLDPHLEGAYRDRAGVLRRLGRHAEAQRDEDAARAAARSESGVNSNQGCLWAVVIFSVILLGLVVGGFALAERYNRCMAGSCDGPGPTATPVPLPDNVHLLSKWGTFTEPWGMAIDGEGNVYVGARGVQVFTSSGEFIRTVVRDYAAADIRCCQFTRPTDVGVDSQGNVYVADATGVQVFTPGGEVLRNLGGFEFQGVAVDGKGNTYRLTNDRRVVASSPSGQPVTQWGSWGAEDIQFIAARDIAVGVDGHVYVLDWRQVRVFRVDLEVQ